MNFAPKFELSPVRFAGTLVLSNNFFLPLKWLPQRFFFSPKLLRSDFKHLCRCNFDCGLFYFFFWPPLPVYRPPKFFLPPFSYVPQGARVNYSSLALVVMVCAVLEIILNEISHFRSPMIVDRVFRIAFSLAHPTLILATHLSDFDKVPGSISSIGLNFFSNLDENIVVSTMYWHSGYL